MKTNSYAALILPFALFLILATSGCVNTSTTSTTTTTTTSTTSTTTTTTWSSTTTSSSSPIVGKLNLEINTLQAPVGSLVTIPINFYNYMPIDLPANSTYILVRNVFCNATVTGLQEMQSYYYSNLLFTNASVTKAAYQEFSITNPGVLSGVAFKINTSYLGTTKLTIPIYFAAPVAALYEYSVCTAVNDAEYQNIARNCQIGYVTETGHTPSDVTPSVKVESQYGDYKIYITFSKNNDDVAQISYDDVPVDAIAFKVYLNQKDITPCCKAEYGLSVVEEGANGYKIVMSSPYIDNSGPFKERIICELTPKNDQLYCDNTAIPGTDTKYGKLAFLDLVVGHVKLQKIGEPEIDLILSPNANLLSCPNSNPPIATYSNVPLLNNWYVFREYLTSDTNITAFYLSDKDFAVTDPYDGTNVKGVITTVSNDPSNYALRHLIILDPATGKSHLVNATWDSTNNYFIIYSDGKAAGGHCQIPDTGVVFLYESSTSSGTEYSGTLSEGTMIIYKDTNNVVHVIYIKSCDNTQCILLVDGQEKTCGTTATNLDPDGDGTSELTCQDSSGNAVISANTGDSVYVYESTTAKDSTTKCIDISTYEIANQTNLLKYGGVVLNITLPNFETPATCYCVTDGSNSALEMNVTQIFPDTSTGIAKKLADWKGLP